MAVNYPYLPSDMQHTPQMAYCIDPILLMYDYKNAFLFCQVISELAEQVGHLKDIVPQNAQQEIPNMSGMEGFSVMMWLDGPVF